MQLRVRHFKDLETCGDKTFDADPSLSRGV